MTLEELGKKVGVSKVTIHKYESKVITNIPSDRIEAMAKALDVSPAYLMGWDDEKDLSDIPGIILPEKLKKDSHFRSYSLWRANLRRRKL